MNLDGVCATLLPLDFKKNNPDFFSIKTPKNPDKETMFKPTNTSKINA